MADDVTYTPGVGATVAADDIGGVLYQRVKIILGSDGTNLGDVDVTRQMPVSGTVTVNPGVSVSAQVSGTVTVSNGVTVTVATGTFSVKDIIPVTTAVSVSVSGVPVWLNPTQPVVVNTIAAGFSVNALVTGAVSISAMPAVSISVSAVLGTIVTQLGTQMVSIAQTSVVAQMSAMQFSTTGVSGLTGPVMWLGASQTLLSIATIGTITTQLGTQMVSMAQTSVSVAVIPTISTLVTVLGTVAVSQVGYLYTTTGVTTGTAQAVWLMNPTTVTVTVSVSQPFGDVISFSFTTVSAPTVQTPALCDVAWLGTTVQTSMYVVPAGRRLRINGIVVQVQNTAASVGIAQGRVFVRASVSSSVTVGPVVAYAYVAGMTSATNAGGGNMVALAVDISTGYSVGFAYQASGGTGHIIGFVVMGNLF